MIRTVIVDDDPAVQRLHTRYLSEVPGFELVGVARTGAAAAVLVTRPDVDFVLLDMNLPDFSGIEVLHRLRIVRDWQADVLVISSARDSTTVRQALSAHVVGYLVKPFTKDVFVRRLTDYRAHRAPRPTEAALPLAQGDIDAIVGGRRDAGGAVRPPHELPKGLSASTLEVIVATLDAVRPTSVRDIVAASGASAPTVRRYLDHLVRTGAVSASHRFGARGRPELLYRRVPE